MKNVRLGIVGCGAITASGHLPAALRSSLVEVAALVDVDLVNAQSLARDLAVECTIADRLEAVIDDLEGVVIATPNHSHLAIGQVALSRRIPTLIEKPISTTYGDAVRLCELAESAETFIAVAYRSRFWWSVLSLKYLLESGYLGRIRSFKYHFGTRSTWAPKSGFNVNRNMAGGGVLIDSHTVDKMIYWFGEPEGFTYWDDNHGGVESTCKAELQFNGSGGPFSGSLFLSKSMDLSNKLVLETERYLCELEESPAAAITLRSWDRPDVAVQARAVGAGSAPRDDRTDFQMQLEEFARNIRQRGTVTVDGRFAAKSIRLIEAMYNSRHDLPEPWLHRSSDMERASV